MSSTFCIRCQRDFEHVIKLVGNDVMEYHRFCHEQNDFRFLMEYKNQVFVALRDSLDILKRIRDFEYSNEEDGRKPFWEDGEGAKAIENQEKVLHLLGEKDA